MDNFVIQFPPISRQMAFYRKRGNTWRAEVERHGIRSSATFETKAAAMAWAGRKEAEIMAGDRQEVPKGLTVADLLKEYEKKVAPTHKGARWEKVRIGLFCRDKLAQVRLRDLDAPHVADWQHRRLQAVSGASVRRERNLLNAAFQIAIKEWRWLHKNPFYGVRRPKGNPPRNRIATQAEIAKLQLAAVPSLRRCIIFALETGMRAKEIAELTDIRGRVAYIKDGKTGAREVPLSPAAIAVWQGGFGLTAGSISALFAKLTASVGIEGLTFHDLRRTAITRLAKTLDPWQLAKMVGHKDLKMTLNVYYRADTEAIADKLA